MTKPAPPTTGRSKFVYFIFNNLPRFVLLLMIAFIFVLMNSIQEEKKIIAANKAREVAPEKPPVNAITLELLPQTISDRINLPGALEPWTHLELMSKIGGTIDEVLVTEGSRVQKGDVLARIDDADYKIAVERAEAAYNLAKNDFERDEAIYKKGVIPTATLDTNRTKMQTARADYDNAKLMLSRTTITSPMDGVIRRLHAKVGLQLGVGDPIGDILEVDRLKATIGIPESDVTAIRKLDSVELTIQALNDRKVIGRKHFLSPSPDTIARVYNLELEIDNSGGELLAGMFVRADVVKKQIVDSVVVPFYSIISRNDRQYVYVDDGGVARRMDVELGIMEKWMVQVKSGLSLGDQLIVEGHRDVEDGQKVSVIKTIRDMEDLHL